MDVLKANETFTSIKVKQMITEISKVVIGQDDLIEKMTIGMLSNGHILLEGVPGVGKTLLAKTMAYTIAAKFKRVQFTPDLMPADLIGTKVFDVKNADFFLRKGPAFTNFLMADEINRTPPKTQAALLEVMEERRITIDGETHKLEEPFFVIATQNSIEYEGTYPLPEAQLDRFMMKLTVEYPAQTYENKMLEVFSKNTLGNEFDRTQIETVFDSNELKEIKKEIAGVKVGEDIINYITNIVRATRSSNAVILGASPRAAIALMQVSKTHAAFEAREFVIPEDVKEFAVPVLRHRLILRPEATLDGVTADDVVRGILAKAEVPR